MYNFKLINVTENNQVWLSFPNIESAVASLMKWRAEFPDKVWSLWDKDGFVIGNKEIVETLSRISFAYIIRE